MGGRGLKSSPGRLGEGISGVAVEPPNMRAAGTHMRFVLRVWAAPLAVVNKRARMADVVRT